jgi:predicted lactoylglutathione lyase
LNPTKVTVSLPTNDLRKAFLFYRDGIGLGVAGVTDDDMPEPVEFVVRDGIHLMLVPADGFSWVTQGNDVAAKGDSECIINVGVETREEVDALIEKAREAGGEAPDPPGQQPWGYTGYFKDLDGHLWMAVCPT